MGLFDARWRSLSYQTIRGGDRRRCRMAYVSINRPNENPARLRSAPYISCLTNVVVSASVSFQTPSTAHNLRHVCPVGSLPPLLQPCPHCLICQIQTVFMTTTTTRCFFAQTLHPPTNTTAHCEQLIFCENFHHIEIHTRGKKRIDESSLARFDLLIL